MKAKGCGTTYYWSNIYQGGDRHMWRRLDLKTAQGSAPASWIWDLLLFTTVYSTKVTTVRIAVRTYDTAMGVPVFIYISYRVHKYQVIPKVIIYIVHLTIDTAAVVDKIFVYPVRVKMIFSPPRLTTIFLVLLILLYHLCCCVNYFKQYYCCTRPNNWRHVPRGRREDTSQPVAFFPDRRRV